MNKHAEIQKLLSPYCGGDLSAADKARVEEHLASCTSCSDDLADLKIALRLIRTTPEVEPPPWLTSRIMARLQEDKCEKRSWLQRLFFPLQIKLPLEALAVLMVCVSGYYLSRTVDPGLNRAIPQLEYPASPRADQKSAGGKKQEQPAGERLEPALPRDEPHKAEKQAAPVESTVPVSPPATVQNALPASAPAPASAKEERPALSAGAGHESKNTARMAESADKSHDTAQKMKKAVPSKEAQRSDSVVPTQNGRSNASGAAAVAYLQVSVRLNPGDEATANESIRRSIAISGGTVVEDDQAPVERKLKARIFANRYSSLLENLGRLGRIVERPVIPDSTGIVEIVIEW